MLRLGVTMTLIACAGPSCTGADESEGESLMQQRVEYQSMVRAYYEELAVCMTDNGMPMELNDYGDGIDPAGVYNAKRGDGSTQYALCSEEVGSPPPPGPPPTEEELRALYALDMDVFECLNSHGFSSTPPPSEQVYVETYQASYSGGSAPWSPYGIEVGPQELEACPQPTLLDIYLK